MSGGVSGFTAKAYECMVFGFGASVRGAQVLSLPALGLHPGSCGVRSLASFLHRIVYYRGYVVYYIYTHNNNNMPSYHSYCVMLGRGAQKAFRVEILLHYRYSVYRAV